MTYFMLGALLGGVAGFALMAVLAMSDKPAPSVPRDPLHDKNLHMLGDL